MLWLAYVTAEFYQAVQYDAVPVVLGGTDYEALAPPHSFGGIFVRRGFGRISFVDELNWRIVRQIFQF